MNFYGLLLDQAESGPIRILEENRKSKSHPCLSLHVNATREQKPEMQNASQDRLLAMFVNQMVASAFELSANDLMQASRGKARASRARQISIYLMHTVLSFSLTKIAKIYSKDRTTVGYACRVIEDLRDTPAFDDRIIELEETVKTVLKLVAYIPGEVPSDE